MQIQKILFKIIVSTCCLINVSISPNFCDAKDSFALNKKILSFGINNLTKTVNNGNCWTFVRDAIRFSSGIFPGPGGNLPSRVFGRKISINQLRPGDIIAFESAAFAYNGRIYSRTGKEHYAIVESVSYGNIRILHQNWNSKRYVIRGSFNPTHLVFGKIIFYRPQST